jgi:YD repeat-containing protein
MRDRAGRVMEHSSVYSSGATSRTVCTYDPNGRLTETVATGTNPRGRPWTVRRVYTYDDSGRLVEERQARADGRFVRARQPIYTADGRRIEEQQFRPRRRGTCGAAAEQIAVDGSNMSFPVPTRARSGRVVYDVRGAPVEMTFIGRLGVTVGKVMFATDAAGRITAIRTYGDTGECCATVPSWLRAVAPLASGPDVAC